MRTPMWTTAVMTGLALMGCGRLSGAADRTEDASKQAPAATRPFLVKPYLQWGDSPDWTAARGLELLWQDSDVAAEWIVESRKTSASVWEACPVPAMRRISPEGDVPFRTYRTSLKGLAPGSAFTYRVRKGGEIVFAAEGRAPAARDQSHRFVVFGDCGANTVGQKAVAYQAYRAKPDFVMITGDIVYSRGRVSEYREKFWPIYNSDQASPAVGAPLLRSVLFTASPGNHDIATRDLGKYPDGLGYFLHWAQPLNGPLGAEGGVLVPALVGPADRLAAFREAAGAAYPRMANFSFDYGNAHWTILDANPYVDWTDRELREWVANDLASARGATWRFVALHQPGFNSSKAHGAQENTRLLSDLFEAGGVDIVFCGHVHNYQRSFPLRFQAAPRPSGKEAKDKDLVAGSWILDRSFDGRDRTKPEGVIYLITGGGGARLYNPEQQDDHNSWKEFTVRFVSRVHSLTVADVDGATLTVRQLSLDGEELDRFVITR